MNSIRALDSVGIDTAGFHLLDGIRHGVFPCDLRLELSDRYGGGVALVVEDGAAVLTRHLAAHHAWRGNVRIGEQTRRFPVAYMQHVGAVGEVRTRKTAYVDHGGLVVIGVDDPFIGVSPGVGSGE